MIEDFITSENSKGFIDKIGKDYLIIKDIQTNEEIKIQVEEAMATYFKHECSDNEVIYVFYDKDSKELKL